LLLAALGLSLSGRAGAQGLTLPGVEEPSAPPATTPTPAPSPSVSPEESYDWVPPAVGLRWSKSLRMQYPDGTSSAFSFDSVIESVQNDTVVTSIRQRDAAGDVVDQFQETSYRLWVDADQAREDSALPGFWPWFVGKSRQLSWESCTISAFADLDAGGYRGRIARIARKPHDGSMYGTTLHDVRHGIFLAGEYDVRTSSLGPYKAIMRLTSWFSPV